VTGEPGYDAFRVVAGNVSRETYRDVVAFAETFRKWAARINLVAPSTLQEIWPRHIMDSAQLGRIEPSATRWIDLGSGGGFPGAIMGLLLKDRPGGSIDLIESNGKKAAFLRSSLGELGAPARVHAKRVEDVYGTVRDPEVVTARALAPLAKLLDLAEPWLAAGATGLFHKGREYRREIQESSAAWTFDLVEHRSLTDSDSVILELRNPRRR
jgi:16S rRNA (guanine527-N7)-methyltransferase